MARTVGRLKVGAIAGLPPGRHSDGDNLAVEVKPSGRRSWFVQIKIEGRTRVFGLGAHTDTFGLLEARRARDAVMQRIRAGDVPTGKAEVVAVVEAAEPAAPAQPLFEAVAEDVICLAMKDNFGAKTEARWRRAIFHHCKPLCPMPIDTIDTGHVVAALETVWTARPSMARKTREHLERVLDYAKARGYRTGDNPARWSGHLDQLLSRVAPAAEPHAALPWTAAPKFVRDLDRHTGVGRNALELVVFTGARSGEVRGATWSEFDLKRKLWSIPRERTKERRTLEKARRTHKRIPLSPAAVAVLERFRPARPKAEEYVFPSPSGPEAPMSENAMLALVDTMGMKANVTPHGFRSTFRDWAAEQRTAALNGRMVPSYSYEAAEMSLGHVVGNEVTRAYLRSDLLDERRDLMNDWADFLLGRPVKASQTPVEAVMTFLERKGLLAEYHDLAEAA